MSKMYFNVFDGAKVHKVEKSKLFDFIQNNSEKSLTISKNQKCDRISITPRHHEYVVKTNVKAKKCTVSNNKIVAIAKNHKRRIFSTIAECSKTLKIDDSNISKVLKGKRTTANGYKFEYVN